MDVARIFSREGAAVDFPGVAKIFLQNGKSGEISKTTFSGKHFMGKCQISKFRGG